MADPFYIGIRFALYADLMLVFGLPLFALYTPGGRDNVGARRPVLLSLTLLGFALSVLSIAAMTASMAGVPLLHVDLISIRAMVADTSMGMAWAVRMAALVLLAVVTIASRRLAAPALLAAIALGSLAWTGHGAAGEGNAGTVQMIGDLVHLLAAAAWLGALAGLAAMLFGRTDPAIAHSALDRFATIGTVIVIAVVGSGLVNGAYLIGWSNLGQLPSTLYGQLLIAKLVLVAAMLGLAAINRLRLTPAFGRTIDGNADTASRALRRSLVVESAAAIAILALVAWLGTLEPPMSM